MELTQKQIQEMRELYHSNKEDLGNLEVYIKENGITDYGLSDVTESFEQGYNNALEQVFSILNIKTTVGTEKAIVQDIEEGILPENFNIDDYTIEYCPYCDSEQVIFSKGVTACPECGKPLAPCSMCEDCDYNTCPYGCTGGTSDEFKKVTNLKISKALGDVIYKYL